MLANPTRRLQRGLKLPHNEQRRLRAWPRQSRMFSQLLARRTTSASSGLVRTPALIAPRLKPPPPGLQHFHRHASTNTTSEITLASGGVTPSSESFNGAWDALINETTAESTASIEPHIGWLKELGLDYGWGVSTLMENVLERVDLVSGLPWWATLVGVTFSLRILVMPLQVRASDIAARLGHLSPTLAPLQQRAKDLRLAGDTMGSAQATREVQAVMAAAGMSPASVGRMILPILVQGPLGFGLFRVTNGMSRLPVPGLEDGGILWFTDLTISDPTKMLPLLAGAGMWYVMKRGGETGQSNMSPGMMQFMKYGFPGITTLIFWGMPAAMQLLAVSSSIWSLLQTSLLRWPTFRRWANIANLPPPRDSSKSAGPYQGTANAYRTPDEIAKSHTVSARWDAVRKPVTDYMKENSKKPTATRLNTRDLHKAKQYEKERRAEIDAARERYMSDHQKRGGRP